MSEDNIKNCPFCGGASFITTQYNARRNRYYVYISCDMCGCRTRAFSSMTDPETESCNAASRAAVEAWNKRTTNTGEECELFKNAQCPHYDPVKTADNDVQI